jgi:hypothetical protein
LQGVSVQRIIEVAVQVACEKAHEIEGREVHALSEFGSTSKRRVRARDGAKAWRCALQVKSPSARRLHWWRIPGPDGVTIEFASVCRSRRLRDPGVGGRRGLVRGHAAFLE